MAQRGTTTDEGTRREERKAGEVEEDVSERVDRWRLLLSLETHGTEVYTRAKREMGS